MRADDTTMFTMFSNNDGVQIVKVLAHDDKTMSPHADTSMFLPNCQKQP